MSDMLQPVASGSRFWGYLALVAFIATIPASNWGLLHLGVVCPKDGPCLIPVWPGVMAPSGVLFAGLSLALRDFVHSRLGGAAAAVAIVLGALLSMWQSPTSLVVASGVAYLFSEFADFAVYAPLRRRNAPLAVLASGLAGSVCDSILFLWLAFGSLDYVVGQVLGKFWMSVGVAALLWALSWARRPSACSAA